MFNCLFACCIGWLAIGCLDDRFVVWMIGCCLDDWLIVGYQVMKYYVI